VRHSPPAPLNSTSRKALGAHTEASLRKLRVQMVTGSGSTTLMNRDRFFAIVSLHTFLGDTISRKVAYYFELRHPMLYLLFTILGAVFASLRMPIFLWPGLFAIFFANGAIYATTTRFVDQQVHKDFNLIALSFWLFIGDVGSVLGSNTWCV